MSKKDEALKQALEALEVVTKKLLAVRDELAECGGRPKTNVFHQRLWDSSFAAYTEKAIPAAEAIREALAEQPTPPPECQTEAEKTAFAFGWFKALEQKRKDEQPAQQQEPVAYIHRQGNHWEVSERFLCDDEKARGWTEEPLYTAPPASKPLTDEQIKEIMWQKLGWTGCAPDDINFARAIEAAHGIKGDA